MNLRGGKIAFFDDKVGVGGGQIILAQLMLCAQVAGLKVSLFAPMARKWSYLLSGITYSTGKYSDRYDFVYLNGFRRFWEWAFVLLLNSKCRVFCHQHIEQPRWRLLAIKFLAFRHRVVWVAISPFVRDRLIVRGVCPNEVILLENSLRPEFPIQSKPFYHSRTIVYLGRLVREKGVSILVNFASANPDWVVHIIGDVAFDSIEYADGLKSSASSNVLFHGHKQNIPEFLSQLGAAFGVVPSIWEEPFGLTALEMVACGLFTVVRPVGGLLSIAETLHLETFDSASDLKLILEEILAAPLDNVSERLNQQQIKLRSHYSYSRYQADFLRVFNVGAT